MGDGSNGPSSAELGLTQKDLGIDSPVNNTSQEIETSNMSPDNYQVTNKPQLEQNEKIPELSNLQSIKEIPGLSWHAKIAFEGYQSQREGGKPYFDGRFDPTLPLQDTKKLIEFLSKRNKTPHAFAGHTTWSEVPLSWQMAELTDYILTDPSKRKVDIEPDIVMQIAKNYLKEAQRQAETIRHRNIVIKGILTAVTLGGSRDNAESILEEANDCELFYQTMSDKLKIMSSPNNQVS